MSSRPDYQETLQQFVALSANTKLATEDKLEQLLKLGCDYLQMELGIIARIHDDRYKLLVVHSVERPLKVGLEFMLEETFCAVTFTHEGPQLVEHAAQDERWHKHPAYINMGLESYIGIRLIVGDEPWGTINFSCARPRARRFVPQDLTLLELMGQWVSQHYQQLLAQQEQLRYFDLSLDPIADLDHNGRILRANAAWQTMFASCSAQLHGTPLLTLIDPRDHALIELALKQAQGGSSTAQLEARTSQEHPRWISWSIIPTLQPERVVIVGREVTMIKSIQQQLIQSRDDAEVARDEALRANSIKGRFLANASHELRTPLYGILGMTQLLLETALTTRQRDYASTIEHSAQSLQLIIDDLLDLSKMEAQTYQLRPERVRLRELVSDVARSLSQAARRKNLELIWLIDPSLPRFIIADPLRLRQILINLTNNAIKFTSHGEVSLHVLAPTFDGDSMILSVKVQDTGPGIEDAALPHLFEPFFRGSADANGTGLGLSICKQLIELMQGQLQVHSVLGRGSTFSFQVKVKAYEEEDEPKTHTLFASKPRVLLIEQGHSTSQELLQFLPSWGIQLQRVQPHPKEIVSMLELARSALTPYNIIMLDSQMGQAEDLLQWMRSDLRFRELCLAWIEPLDDANELASELAHIVLTRPLQRERLLEAMLTGLESLKKPSLQEDSEIIVLPSSATYQEHPVLLSTTSASTQRHMARIFSQYNISIDITDGIAQTRRALQRNAYPLLILDLDQALVSTLEATLEDAPLLTIIGLTAKPSSPALEVDLLLSPPLTDEHLHATLAPLLLSKGLIQQAELARHDGSKLQILVVEDQLINQRVVEGYLEKMGCQVTIAHHGQEALSLTSAQRFDAILMDCQMPVLDGYEATRQLRQREQEHILRYTPIIALTAYATQEDRQRALNAGMDEVLTKPIQREQLFKTLANWVYPELDAKTSTPQLTHSPRSPLAQTSQLDQRRWAQLLTDCQDLCFVRELVTDFITQAEDNIKQLGSLQLQAQELLKLAHTIKGTASIFGLINLTELSAAIHQRGESLTRDERDEQARALIKAYREAIEALKTAIDDEERRLAPNKD